MLKVWVANWLGFSSLIAPPCCFAVCISGPAARSRWNRSWGFLPNQAPGGLSHAKQVLEGVAQAVDG